MSDVGAPLHTFRFELTFTGDPPDAQGSSSSPPDAAFSECTGLEATMEPKVVKVGGRNVGARQLVGPVTYGTVVLKRGISRGGKLFKWFERVSTGDYGYRCNVRIELKAPAEGERGETTTVLTWVLDRALPVKFKAADFNAKATDVGIEELHLVHEGLTLETGGS